MKQLTRRVMGWTCFWFAMLLLGLWAQHTVAAQHPAPRVPAEVYYGAGINNTDGDQVLVKVRPLADPGFGVHERRLELGILWFKDMAEEPTITFVNGRCLVRYRGRCTLFEQVRITDFDTVSNHALLAGYRLPFLKYYAASVGAAWIDKDTYNIDSGFGAYAGVYVNSTPVGKYCVQLSAGVNHLSSITDDTGIDGVFLGAVIPIGGCAN